MMIPSRPLSRRSFLRGASVAVALPWLEAMLPRGRAHAGGVSSSPTRLVTFFLPNGFPNEFLVPEQAGPDYAVTPLLEPLAAHLPDCTIVSGIRGVNGPDRHAAGICAFSTGLPCSTVGAGGPSIEQVAAAHHDSQAPFSSMAVAVKDSGSWSSNGHSSDCFTNIAWAAADTPVPADRDPALLFNRMFSDGTPQAVLDAEIRAAHRHSVLDVLKNDIARLSPRLGAEDRRRVEAHLDAIREVEARIDFEAACAPPDPPAGYPAELGNSGYVEVANLQADLLVVALSCGLTHHASFMYHDGASPGGPDSSVGLSGQQHELAHSGNRQMLHEFSRVHIEAFVRFLDGLAAIDDGGVSLLHNSLVFMGTELGDGTTHAYDDLPFVIAGHASGRLNPGRHLPMPDVPLAQLQLAVLHAAGVEVDSFAGTSSPAALS